MKRDKGKDAEPYTKASITAFMTSWFLCNYENPVESCPHDEGEFVFIWGGPYLAEEELQEQFGHLFDEQLIAEVAAQIDDEHDGYEWSGVPIEEEDDRPDPEQDDDNALDD
jgi:hypothetical protein